MKLLICNRCRGTGSLACGGPCKCCNGTGKMIDMREYNEQPTKD